MRPTLHEPAVDTRDFSTLLKDLRDGIVRLVAYELRLLRVETVESIRRLCRDLAVIAVGAAIAFFALAALIAALCIGVAVVLEQFMPAAVAWWLGPLLAAGALAGIAVVLIRRGLAKLRSRRLTPAETLDSLETNSAWIREKIS